MLLRIRTSLFQQIVDYIKQYKDYQKQFGINFSLTNLNTRLLRYLKVKVIQNTVLDLNQNLRRKSKGKIQHLLLRGGHDSRIEILLLTALLTKAREIVAGEIEQTLRTSANGIFLRQHYQRPQTSKE